MTESWIVHINMQNYYKAKSPHAIVLSTVYLAQEIAQAHG